MNPRLYEKLYGLRAIIPLALVILVLLIGWGVIHNLVIPPVPTPLSTAISAATNPPPATPQTGVTDTSAPPPGPTLTAAPPTAVPTTAVPPTVEPTNTPTTEVTLTPTATIVALTSTSTSSVLPTQVSGVACNPKPRRIIDGQYVFRCSDTLERVAQDFCGSPSYWLMIYRANRDKITDPSNIMDGTKLVIPCIPG